MKAEKEISAEIRSAIELAENLSAKSSDSGLSEETCWELFGGPCPAALRKGYRYSEKEITNLEDTFETETTIVEYIEETSSNETSDSRLSKGFVVDEEENEENIVDTKENEDEEDAQEVKVQESVVSSIKSNKSNGSNKTIHSQEIITIKPASQEIVVSLTKSDKSNNSNKTTHSKEIITIKPASQESVVSFTKSDKSNNSNKTTYSQEIIAIKPASINSQVEQSKSLLIEESQRSGLSQGSKSSQAVKSASLDSKIKQSEKSITKVESGARQNKSTSTVSAEKSASKQVNASKNSKEHQSSQTEPPALNNKEESKSQQTIEKQDKASGKESSIHTIQSKSSKETRKSKSFQLNETANSSTSTKDLSKPESPEKLIRVESYGNRRDPVETINRMSSPINFLDANPPRRSSSPRSSSSPKQITKLSSTLSSTPSSISVSSESQDIIVKPSKSINKKGQDSCNCCTTRHTKKSCLKPTNCCSSTAGKLKVKIFDESDSDEHISCVKIKTFIKDPCRKISSNCNCFNQVTQTSICPSRPAVAYCPAPMPCYPMKCEEDFSVPSSIDCYVPVLPVKTRCPRNSCPKLATSLRRALSHRNNTTESQHSLECCSTRAVYDQKVSSPTRQVCYAPMPFRYC